MIARGSFLVNQSVYRLFSRLIGVPAQPLISSSPRLKLCQHGRTPLSCIRNLSLYPCLLFSADLSEKSQQEDEKSASPERTVFVANFKWPVTETSLREHFSKFGQIEQFVWGQTKLTKQARGFALVTFARENDLSNVLRQPHDLLGFQLIVKKYLQRSVGETCVVEVRNLDEKWRKEDLLEHFSKYGSVVAIDWPIHVLANAKQDRCFIQFSSKEEAEEALKKENQILSDQRGGQEILVSKSTSKAHKSFEGTKRLIAIADTTVESIATNFTKFGSIEAIWGNFSMVGPNSTLRPTFSLLFKEVGPVEEITKQSHFINNQEIFTLRGAPKLAPWYPFERRIVVDKLPYEVTGQDVIKHFHQFGIVNQLHFVRVPETGEKVACIVTFEKRETVARVIAEGNPKLCGQKVRVRSVGYRNLDDTVIDLISATCSFDS
ncbi:RNA-binding protein Musashi homolog 1-like [Montipora foliosa]|uniref:RNA-binding protein Musashi homolog 1-like n=1 Tax=Montipora foliosa TaxID=591990 RepID=UPI0035F0FC4C